MSPFILSSLIRPASGHRDKPQMNLFCGRKVTLRARKQGEISVSDWPTGGGGGAFDISTCVFDTEWLFSVSAEPSGRLAERDIMQDDEQVLQPAVLL